MTNEDKTLNISAALTEKLNAVGAKFLVVTGVEDERGGYHIARLCNASRHELMEFFTVLVNEMPEVRAVFRPSFVELCSHAPRYAGGDGLICESEEAAAEVLKSALRGIDKENGRTGGADTGAK